MVAKFVVVGALMVVSNIAVSAVLAGKYTDFRYHEHPGEDSHLSGTHLHILPGGKKGFVQFADGDDPLVYPVNIEQHGGRLAFTVVCDCSDAGTFKGSITRKAVRGEFTYADGGGTRDLQLKRGTSKWAMPEH